MKADNVHSILVVDDEKVIRDGCRRLLGGRIQALDRDKAGKR